MDISQNPDAIKINNEALDLNSLMDSFYQYQGLLTILFIPAYAFASWISFLDFKKYNFAEHFVINIYTNAHFFIFWCVFTLLTIPLKINYIFFSQYSFVIMIIYMTYTFKRLLSISMLNSFVRSIVYYIIAIIVIIIGVLFFTIAYGLYLASSGQITPINLQY